MDLKKNILKLEKNSKIVVDIDLLINCTHLTLQFLYVLTFVIKMSFFLNFSVNNVRTLSRCRFLRWYLKILD